VQKLKNDGNFRDAYDGFRRLCLDPNAGNGAVSQDLNNATECLNNLGRIQEFDDLVGKAVAVHQQNWRLLQTAARQCLNVEHQGFRIAGKYERGQHRGGGEPANSDERDRVRALQLMVQALPLAQQDDRKDEVSQFWMNLAEMLLSNRGFTEAWRLQTLTDLATLPDYDEGYVGYREYNGAPVDAEGKPVYHTIPKSWEASETDGQRWRWALAQAVENSPGRLNSVRFHLAQFFEQQFGVTSIQQGRGGGFFVPQSDDDTKKDESGTYALHTLKDNETIARLASGIKRYELPDEFNHIKIYQQIVAEPRTGSDVDLGGLDLLRGVLLEELFVGVQARLALRLPRARRHADPLELARERPLARRRFLLLLAEAALHRASQVLPYIVASSVYPYRLFPTTRGDEPEPDEA
jgi:hypothetical protein